MTSVVNLAINALEEVLGAYATVKTNAEHLKGLAKRCEIVVDSLQLVVNERGEAYAEQLRIERLVETFEHISSTMRRIGRRKWWEMLADAGKDSSAVQACHHLISDLIILFNLHEPVDLGRWNREQLQEHQIEHGNMLRTEERIGRDQEILSSQAAWQNTAVARPVWRIDDSTENQKLRRGNTLPLNTSRYDSTRRPPRLPFPFRPAPSTAVSSPAIKIMGLQSYDTTLNTSSLRRAETLSVPRHGTGFPSRTLGSREEPRETMLRSMDSNITSLSTRATRGTRSGSATSSTTRLSSCDPRARVQAPHRQTPLAFFARPFDTNDLQYLNGVLTDPRTRTRRRHSTRSSASFILSTYSSRRGSLRRRHSCSYSHAQPLMLDDESPVATNMSLLTDEDGISHSIPTEMTASLVSHCAVRAPDSPTPLSEVASEPIIFAGTTDLPQPRGEHRTLNSALDGDSAMAMAQGSPPTSQERSASRWREHLEIGTDGFGIGHHGTARIETVASKADPKPDGGIVDVFFVSDVPDGGFILDHADRIGDTTASVLAEWSSFENVTMSGLATTHRSGRLRRKPAAVQEIRVAKDSDWLDELRGNEVGRRAATIVLRLAPATNPYSLLRSVSPTSHSGSGNSTKRVVLVNSIEPIVLVCAMFRGSEGQRLQDGTTYPIWAVFAWPALTTVAAMKESIARILANKPSLYAEVPGDAGSTCPVAGGNDRQEVGEPVSFDASDTTKGRLSLNLRSSLGRRTTLSRSRSHGSQGSPLLALRRAIVTSSSPFFRRSPSHATPDPSSEPHMHRDLVESRGPNPNHKAPSGVDLPTEFLVRIDASHIVMSLSTDELERDYPLDGIDDDASRQRQVLELGDRVTLRQCAAVLSGEPGVRSNPIIVRTDVGGIGSVQDLEVIALPGNAYFCAEVRTREQTSFP